MDNNEKFLQLKDTYEQKCKEYEIAQRELNIAKATLYINVKTFSEKISQLDKSLKEKYGIEELNFDEPVTMEQVKEIERKLQKCFNELSGKLERYMMSGVIEDESSVLALTEVTDTREQEGPSSEINLYAGS